MVNKQLKERPSQTEFKRMLKVYDTKIANCVAGNERCSDELEELKVYFDREIDTLNKKQ